MINNLICESCQCEQICLVRKKAIVFHEDAKTDLGMDITIDSCANFKKVVTTDGDQ